MKLVADFWYVCTRRLGFIPRCGRQAMTLHAQDSSAVAGAPARVVHARAAAL
jgi:hypothetical protein